MNHTVKNSFDNLLQETVTQCAELNSPLSGSVSDGCEKREPNFNVKFNMG
jgi:hypothetical protein